MHTKDITIDIHLEEDERTTRARIALDLAGEGFAAEGTARRNPADAPAPVIGEELAVARALADLHHQVMEAAHRKLEAQT